MDMVTIGRSLWQKSYHYDNHQKVVWCTDLCRIHELYYATM